jgi:hypothetical protein
LKADYEKLMVAYNKKQVTFWITFLEETNAPSFAAFFSMLTQLLTQESTDDDEDEGPGRSKPAVNDEDDEESGEVIYISYDLMVDE